MRKLIPITMLLCLLPCISYAHDAPSYSIKAVIEPSAGSLTAEARIDLPATQSEWKIRIAGLEIISASIEGRQIRIRPGTSFISVKGGRSVRIEYSMLSSEAAGSGNPENPGVVAGNLISERGVALDDGWYPEVTGAGLSDFSLKAVLPSDYKAISEADEIAESASDGRTEYSFFFPHALDGITLVAGRYNVSRSEQSGVELYAYFFPESEGLAEQYLAEAGRAIETYQKMLGVFPYKRFSVVENALPTGYSMPTYTLLGSSVVRLPFISSTSLWHEVLHQWFGNSVFMASEDGNWAEGLAAYLADHRIDETQGDGPGHRKRLLLDFRNYVNPSNDFPLRRFAQRSDRATRSIGYGKGAMFFHMLRRELGDEFFISGLRMLVEERTGDTASWDDLQAAFEKASGRDLKDFFRQWLTRTGYPAFGVRDAAGVMLGGGYRVSFVIEQQGDAWTGLAIPVRVRGAEGEVFETIRLKGKITPVEMDSPGRPLEIIIDPGYDIFRGLLEVEAPPVVSALLGAQSRLVINPESDTETYTPVIDALKAQGFKERAASDVKDSELRSSSFVILGHKSMIANMLFGKGFEEMGEGFSLKVAANPYSSRRAVGIIQSSSREESELAGHKLSHYGRYSNLEFSSGRNTLKSVAPSDEGMRIELYEPPAGIETAKALSIDTIIDRLAAYDVIYVGERHDRYEDHKLQLEVLSGLHARGYKVALGMEMFESAFQNALDDYVGGGTSEERMLIASNYFDAWGMNWHLYRELVDFAKSNAMPVLGLNQREAVVKKIARGGLDALSKEERAELPSGLDLSDRDYIRTLREIFTSHGPTSGQDFTNFTQAQIVRDERMAESMAGFMRANPGVKVVVAAGQGHVVYGHGIPKRLLRRAAHKYAVVMNAESSDFDPDGADYLVSMRPLSAPQTPMLGVVLKDTPRGVLIEAASPGSLAQRGGLTKGDIIISADGEALRKVAELKALMFRKKPGDTLKITFDRERWLLGPRKMQAELALE